MDKTYAWGARTHAARAKEIWVPRFYGASRARPRKLLCHAPAVHFFVYNVPNAVDNALIYREKVAANMHTYICTKKAKNTYARAEEINNESSCVFPRCPGGRDAARRRLRILYVKRERERNIIFTPQAPASCAPKYTLMCYYRENCRRRGKRARARASLLLLLRRVIEGGHGVLRLESIDEWCASWFFLKKSRVCCKAGCSLFWALNVYNVNGCVIFCRCISMRWAWLQLRQ